jgi:hypothetical protein
MHPASNRAGPGVISRASIGLTQARRLSYYTVRRSSSSMPPHMHRSKQVTYKRRSQQAGNWAFLLVFLSPIVHVEPEALSLGDGANRTCQGLGVLSEGVQSIEIRNERVQILLAVHKLSIYGRRLLFEKKTYWIPRRVCFVGLTWPEGRGGILFGVRGVSEI